MSADSNLVCLRRNDTATAWGFRLNGGAEYGQPLYIYKVSFKNLYFEERKVIKYNNVENFSPFAVA